MERPDCCPHCGGKIKQKIGYGGVTFFLCQNEECKACTSFGGPRKIHTGAWEAEDPVKNFNRRAIPANPPLTCEGCIHDDPDAEWDETCFDGKRMPHTADMYAHKPEEASECKE